MTLEERIATLSGNLGDAAASISSIETEIEARQKLVTKLEQDQQRYEALAQMDRQELEAVAQTLREQIQESKSFWDSLLGRFVWSFSFLLLGALVLAPLGQWMGRRLFAKDSAHGPPKG